MYIIHTHRVEWHIDKKCACVSVCVQHANHIVLFISFVYVHISLCLCTLIAAWFLRNNSFDFVRSWSDSSYIWYFISVCLAYVTTLIKSRERKKKSGNHRKFRSSALPLLAYDEFYSTLECVWCYFHYKIWDESYYQRRSADDEYDVTICECCFIYSQLIQRWRRLCESQNNKNTKLSIWTASKTHRRTKK